MELQEKLDHEETEEREELRDQRESKGEKVDQDSPLNQEVQE